MSPQFKFKGVNASGKESKGRVEADSDRQAREKLRDKGIYPTDIQAVESSTGKGIFQRDIRSKKISTMQLAVMSRQLTTLVGAGLPLVDSLKALSEQLDNEVLREAIIQVRDKVNQGTPFYKSLEEYPNIFPRLYVIMIRGGEASGTLDAVLTRLADMLEAQAILQRKVISALAYPILMLCLCFGVLLLLLAYVVPQISEIFKDRGKALPFMTQIIVSISDILRSYWWVLILIITAIIWALLRYKKTPKGKAYFDRITITNPLFGTLALKIATARLATNLGTMLKSGIDLLGALKESKHILSNSYLEESVETAQLGVEQGRSLAHLLSQSGRFPKMFIHMIAIGERSGSLDEMLLRTGKALETEVEAIITGLTALLEPILIIFLAFVVGGVLAAVMLPMLEVTAIGSN